MGKSLPGWIAAIAVPIFYLFCYTPYGMDTTDFGYFYAYAWRILQGQVPYRDFFYIKPAFPLYWHAFWLKLTPFEWQILGGKAGFCMTMLAAAWLGALYLARAFNLAKIGISLPLLATCGFVYGIHSFPHMPWHTADGVFFCAASLYCALCAWPVASGLLTACAIACKQSFALLPFAILLLLWLKFGKLSALRFICGLIFALGGFYLLLKWTGAWPNFLTMTTGQLDINEALDAGIYIYLRQNWLLPVLALLPALCFLSIKKNLPIWLEPAWCYLICLTVWYIYEVYTQKTWIGFGASWPTLFVVLGGVAVLWPKQFLLNLLNPEKDLCFPKLTSAVTLAAALLVSWSAAISGGYKIPAMFAAPLLFSFFIIHSRFYDKAGALAWGSLFTGLLIFWAGYQYPYTFPVRPLAQADFQYNAGEIYPQASGVYIDKDMYERLSELKYLREKYGPNYKTLPGFSFSYYLNGDKPRIGSDWLIDWEINGKVDQLYNEMLNKNVTALIERDQLNTAKADAYERAGYGVPQRIVKLWKVVDETPHFVIFQRP